MIKLDIFCQLGPEKQKVLGLTALTLKPTGPYQYSQPAQVLLSFRAPNGGERCCG